MTKEQLAEQASRKLWVFPKLVSGHKCPPFLKYVCEAFEKLFATKTDKIKILIVNGPPRHGKTEQLPVHAPAHILGRFPKLKIIIAAYAASLAEKHSSKARDIFKEWGEMLWGVLPNMKVFGKSLWQTNQGGEVLAVGVDGGASGYGADVFFFDDYHKNRKEAESLVKRETVWSFWQSVINTRIHPNGIVVFFATRWHDDDVIGRILKQHEAEGEESPFMIVHINLKAIAEKDDPIGRKTGEALWPGRYNAKRLANIKKSIGSYEWSALYQGEPTVRGGTLFKSQYFRYYTFDSMTKEYICYRKDIAEPIRIKKAELTRHVYCDPSLEIKKTNDPTGALAWGYSRRHKVWLLLDRLNGRIEHTQVMSRLKLFAFKNSCTKIGIENEKLGKVLVKQSAGNDSVGGVKIPFVEIPTGGLDKYARATPMAGYIENERVFFPKDAEWLANYESALVKFPNDKHDEDVDTTAMAEHMESRKTLAEVLSGK